jgi:hypothetical protein
MSRIAAVTCSGVSKLSHSSRVGRSLWSSINNLPSDHFRGAITNQRVPTELKDASRPCWSIDELPSRCSRPLCHLPRSNAARCGSRSAEAFSSSILGSRHLKRAMSRSGLGLQGCNPLFARATIEVLSRLQGVRRGETKSMQLLPVRKISMRLRQFSSTGPLLLSVRSRGGRSDISPIQVP